MYYYNVGTLYTTTVLERGIVERPWAGSSPSLSPRGGVDAFPHFVANQVSALSCPPTLGIFGTQLGRTATKRGEGGGRAPVRKYTYIHNKMACHELDYGNFDMGALLETGFCKTRRLVLEVVT